MTESPLIEAARQWVIDNYPYNSYHLIKSLEWLDRIAPEASEAMRLATLTHDMERAFPGPDQPVAKSLIDPEYNAAHSARSARIIGSWLRENHTSPELIGEVEDLVRAHEVGGWPEANLVQAADSLSFLETNVDLFLNMIRTGKRAIDDVRAKFDYSYDRIQLSHARELALPLLEQANARLAALSAARSGASVEAL
jgi:Domain of unknown function (DUF4202)